MPWQCPSLHYPDRALYREAIMSLAASYTVRHSTQCPGCSPQLLRCQSSRVSQTRAVHPVRAAAGESGPTLQRPSSRQVQAAEPEAPSRPDPQQQERPQSSNAPPPTVSSDSAGITVEYQRRQAKEMTAYFRSLVRAETVQKSQVFGWTRKNEITNGRWVMFGLLVGLMTEYATGVDFPNQIKLLFSYLGILDIYD
ncbi:hypothetical protein WJX84_009962 [Apatococcus fuscideae]|uniref:Uncharacterized protein n=1 Tax=Apatococcus fuscideae TaxID=2026836 RepID=A0AAW1TBJ5_9CHLO